LSNNYENKKLAEIFNSYKLFSTDELGLNDKTSPNYDMLTPE